MNRRRGSFHSSEFGSSDYSEIEDTQHHISPSLVAHANVLDPEEKVNCVSFGSSRADQFDESFREDVMQINTLRRELNSTNKDETDRDEICLDMTGRLNRGNTDLMTTPKVRQILTGKRKERKMAL